MTLISTLSTSNYLLDLTISRGVIAFQFIWLGVGVVLLCGRRINELWYTFFFLLPIIMLTKFIKGFSGGLSLLHPNLEILPRMRASVAFKALADTAHLDASIDPHLVYPQEFIIVYVLKLITGGSIIDLYEIAMKSLSIAFWLILALLLFKLMNSLELQSRITRCLLITLLTSILVTFQPGYSEEVSYAYPLLAIGVYILRKYGVSSLIESRSVVIIMLLSLGVILGSQRETFVLLTLSILLLFFNAFVRIVKPFMIYTVSTSIALSISVLTLVQLLYNAWLYSRAYLSYFQALLQVIREVLRGKWEIARPPLHTLAQIENPVDRWMSYLGSISLFTMLTVSSIIGLAILIHSLYGLLYLGRGGKSKVDINVVDLGMVVTFLAFGSIIAVQYIMNVLGLWNIDFESTIPLLKVPLLYIPIIGAKVLPKLGLSNMVKPPFTNSRYIRFVEVTVIVFLLIVLIPSALGLPLRTPVKTYSDVLNIKGDPVELTISANNIYSFVLQHNLQEEFVLDPRFSGHYLYLPLRYVGLYVTTLNFYIKLDAENSDAIILASGSFVAYLSSGKIYVYDGERIIMPY